MTKTPYLADDAPAPRQGLAPRALPKPHLTLAEQLHRIEQLGQRITTYVQFTCQVGSLNGTSAEAKERAVADFLERLTVLERQLRTIQDDLRLG